MKLTKEQILSASDEELNELCATKIHGWVLHHPKISTANYRLESGHFVEMQCNYHPVRSIEQATQLLTHLRSKWGLPNFDWLIRTPYNQNVYEVQMYRSEELPHFQSTYKHESMTKAIVIASLLAIVAMEEA